MTDRSSIEWTDATWNPVTGCTQVSPGCDSCYALTLAERFRGTEGHYFEHGFDLVLRPAKLDQPLRWRKPRRIFVNSMSDLFHEQIPDDYIARVFAIMALAPHHTFQLLTKRHGRMRSLLSQSPGGPSDSFVQRVKHWMWVIAGDNQAAVPGWNHRLDQKHEWWPLDNVWIGVSVETQQWANIRIPALRATPAAVRFLSCEPLLGPIQADLDGIDWVIVGGESGPGARLMRSEWASSLADQCRDADVRFFMKQAGTALAREWGVPGKGADPCRWPIQFPQEYPQATDVRSSSSPTASPSIENQNAGTHRRPRTVGADSYRADRSAVDSAAAGRSGNQTDRGVM